MYKDAIFLFILSRFKYFQYLTKWNILLMFLQNILEINSQELFLNSLSVMFGFHFGGSDRYLYKYMKTQTDLGILSFMNVDYITHCIPCIYSTYMMLSNNLYITFNHILRYFLWHIIFYIFVGKNINCYLIYGEYAYKRTITFQVINPFIVMYIINSHNLLHYLVYLSMVWYAFLYFDLIDSPKYVKD